MDSRRSESTLSLGQAQEDSQGETMTMIVTHKGQEAIEIETHCVQSSMKKNSLSINHKGLQFCFKLN